MLVVGLHWRRDAVPGEQVARMTRVFGENRGHAPQRLDRAQADVAKIADGRTDHEQLTCGRVSHGVHRGRMLNDNRLDGAGHPGGKVSRARPSRYACSANFRSRCDFGTAPTTVSTCFPSLKNRMLGMDRTLNRIAVC